MTLFDDLFYDIVPGWTKTENGYILEIEVPGFNKSNLTVSRKSAGVIEILGKTQKRELKKYISIPENVGDDSITAEVRDGILTLGFKEPEKSKKKFIEVK